MAWRQVLEEFYTAFQERLEGGRPIGGDRPVDSRGGGESCELCGAPWLVKWKRFGRFLGVLRLPGVHQHPLPGWETGRREVDLALGADEETRGADSSSVRGPTALSAEGEGEKPRRVSLPRSGIPPPWTWSTPGHSSSFPRVLGTDPRERDSRVTRASVRYGPYVEKGRNSGSPQRRTPLPGDPGGGAGRSWRSPRGGRCCGRWGKHPVLEGSR